jgi:hypothetical protein
MMNRILVGLVAISLTLLAGGCGDEETRPQDPADTVGPMSQPTSRDSPVAGDDTSPVAPSPPRDDPAGVLKGRKAVPTPGGGVYYAPVKPRVETVAPSVSCSHGRDESRPTRPGLRAVRTAANRVRVRILLEPVARSCAAKFVRLGFDVNGDALPPLPPRAGVLIPVARFTPWLEVVLPDGVKDADVLHAISVTSDGRSGDSATVLISDED